MFDLRGVRTRISAPSFPYQHPQLAVHLQMTGHEGAARGRIVVVNARTDEVLFSKAPHEVQFHGPLHFVPVSLWITDCTFPEEGIYYVQVHFDDKLIGERSLHLALDEATASNGQHPG